MLLAVITKSIKRRKRLIIGGVVSLFIFSNPFIFREFERAWEVKNVKLFSANDTADIVVVLGGIVSFDDRLNQLDFHENADRILNVLPLYFENRVRKILLSGGSGSLLQEELEAAILKQYLVSIGVRKEDILTDKKSRNTYENALYSGKIIKEQHSMNTIMLSTSSIHMKRSMLCFQKQGIEVIPFIVDGTERREFYPSELLLPKAEILNDWYRLIHEWLGVLVYKIMGYC